MKTSLMQLMAAALLTASLHSAASAPWDSMEKIGEGKLRFAFWDIYTAKLFSQNNRFSFEQPFALQIHYLRDVEKSKLIDNTADQWQRFSFPSEKAEEHWLAELDRLWVSVQKGDRLTLHVDESGRSHFFHNHERLGEIADPKFARHFAAIWLDENTSNPKLRVKLLGQSP